MITQALICLQGKPPEIRTLILRGLPSKPRVILARALGVLSTRGFTCQYILASCGMATRYTVPAYVSLVDAVKALALKTGIARASTYTTPSASILQCLFPRWSAVAARRYTSLSLGWVVSPIPKSPFPTTFPPSQTASIQGDPRCTMNLLTGLSPALADACCGAASRSVLL